jgi:hypothetical protein
MKMRQLKRFIDSLLPDLAVLQSHVKRESDWREVVKKPQMDCVLIWLYFPELSVLVRHLT